MIELAPLFGERSSPEGHRTVKVRYVRDNARNSWSVFLVVSEEHYVCGLSV